MIEDIENILSLGNALRLQSLTIPDICKQFNISKRTAYRWVDSLEKKGYRVLRQKKPDGGFHFFIE